MASLTILSGKNCKSAPVSESYDRGASAPKPHHNGSIPLKNARREAFCQILSRPAPPSLLAAWCESALAVGRPVPQATPGLRVSASNVHASEDVLSRLAYLRLERARAKGATDTLTEARLSELMRECTECLVAASEAAERAGVSAAQASAIRKSIIVHAGRSDRLRKRVDPEPEPVPVKLPNVNWCQCS